MGIYPALTHHELGQVVPAQTCHLVPDCLLIRVQVYLYTLAASSSLAWPLLASLLPYN